MMLIWAHGLGPEVNPIRELYESLTAVGKRPVAGKLSFSFNLKHFLKFYCVLDTLRKKLDQENEDRRKGKRRSCSKCSIT